MAFFTSTVLQLVILSLGITGLYGLKFPRHFYHVNKNNTMLISQNRFYTAPGFVFPSGFPFLGNKGCDEYDCNEELVRYKVGISKNGYMRTGDNPIVPEPFPLESRQDPLIAPFWTKLLMGDEGVVYYQQTTKRRRLRQAAQDVSSNFGCGSDFMPTDVLIVTWHNMEYLDCVLRTSPWNYDQKCLCLMDETPKYCECTVDYSIQEYCSCYASNETCSCDFAMDYWVDSYCQCLVDYNDGLCSCFAWEEESVCHCMRRLGDYEACDCARYRSEAWCYCMYVLEGSYPECYCHYKHDEEYCACMMHYWDTFYEEGIIDDNYNEFEIFPDFSNGFCDCVTTNRSLSACLCTSNTTTSPVYCACLAAYESYLEQNGANHTMIHAFCLCVENSTDPVGCGCDSCLSRNIVKKEEILERSLARTSVRDVSYGKRKVMQKNTFQAVLMTNGNQSYVMFNYGHMDVPKDENGQYLVTVGFGGGEGLPYFNHRLSQSKKVPKLLKKSNVGVPGRWMYRVDGETVLEPQDCN